MARGACRDGACEVGAARQVGSGARAGRGLRPGPAERAEPGPGRSLRRRWAGPRGEQRGLGPVPALPGAQRRGESAGAGPGPGGGDAEGRVRLLPRPPGLNCGAGDKL